EAGATGCFKAAEEAARQLHRYIYTCQGPNEELLAGLYHRYYHNGLRVYSPQNIKACVELLVRRVKESGQDY
ncbi:MAG: hypothetical protein ACPLUI_11980, partial [Desulfofundulus sp.]